MQQCSQRSGAGSGCCGGKSGCERRRESAAVIRGREDAHSGCCGVSPAVSAAESQLPSSEAEKTPTIIPTMTGYVPGGAVMVHLINGLVLGRFWQPAAALLVRRGRGTSPGHIIAIGAPRGPQTPPQAPGASTATSAAHGAGSGLFGLQRLRYGGILW